MVAPVSSANFVQNHSSPTRKCTHSSFCGWLGAHGVRSDFLLLEPVADQWIEMANGERIAVEGRGPVSLLLGGKIVQEADWLFVPSLAMRLKSVRLHRRLHPDACFLATHEECLLVYPTFALEVDDSEDCLLPCQSAPPGGVPHFLDPLLGSSSALSEVDFTVGHAFAAHRCRRPGRRFTPFPHSAGSLQAQQLDGCSQPASTRDVPSQFVPNSASPALVRFSNEELHKFFGNRRMLDWKSLEEVCQGGKVTDLGETPLSIGNFVNRKRGRRGKRAALPRPGHTLCLDVGVGDGISPGGHRYCLVVVDAGSRMCWCYGLRDLSGSTIADALLQLLVDVGQDLGNSPVRRILCDFDTKLIRGQARHLLLRKEIRILCQPGDLCVVAAVQAVVGAAVCLSCGLSHG